MAILQRRIVTSYLFINGNWIFLIFSFLKQSDCWVLNHNHIITHNIHLIERFQSVSTNSVFVFVFVLCLLWWSQMATSMPLLSPVYQRSHCNSGNGSLIASTHLRASQSSSKTSESKSVAKQVRTSIYQKKLHTKIFEKLLITDKQGAWLAASRLEQLNLNPT